MSWEPYDYEKADHEVEITEDGVFLEIMGSYHWESDGFGHERSETRRIQIPPSELKHLVNALYEEYKCTTDHEWWYEETGMETCGMCGCEIDVEGFE